MTKRINAKKKASRKLGGSLWGQAKDPYLKRNYRPGQHGAASKRTSDYGNQLRAKQRMKFYYGNISERQFYNIFLEANKMKGDNSENFVSLLESRLDTVVYRANFVPTVFAARQFVNHKHVMVNGKAVNIPSYRLKVGDVVQVRDKSRKLASLIESLQKMERDIPAYLSLDKDNFSIKLTAKPAFAEVPYAIEMQPHFIIEFYSR
ncbi:MAG: 30S ribosomal protein S4 [Alphaproteobacteria bacterium RIFCSPLOWO2_01_FULL_40_26]|nr:MAG: 30S ribosomal protein S4 [Alphaproteobacteria bacterium RIFCSPHIGHO2_02_FULL_40_34]OFW95164.1 MAG: 30S ribosomal protein S4 [Alphaproteobacteria bacterium RIFCSPLOWO2_01_FULL_40_26]OFX10618.1 MAG: 30S ribosomal protein S4 [Alphaproteobacteria bacterium RIFCSPLOWO2_02_FULL_40_19]